MAMNRWHENHTSLMHWRLLIWKIFIYLLSFFNAVISMFPIYIHTHRFGGTVRHYRLYFEGNDHYVGEFCCATMKYFQSFLTSSLSLPLPLSLSLSLSRREAIWNDWGSSSRWPHHSPHGGQQRRGVPSIGSRDTSHPLHQPRRSSCRSSKSQSNPRNYPRRASRVLWQWTRRTFFEKL